ncbi:MAG TPA: hypothetical protein VGJ20_35990 [Xanthobacteraceae bacterium]
MRKMFRFAFAIGIVLSTSASDVALAGLAGPGPWGDRLWVWGNDTGGIIPYSPVAGHVYRAMARDHCAQWGRLSHITSVHRRYGDYISFVCIDKPWMIH